MNSQGHALKPWYIVCIKEERQWHNNIMQYSGVPEADKILQPFPKKNITNGNSGYSIQGRVAKMTQMTNWLVLWGTSVVLTFPPVWFEQDGPSGSAPGQDECLVFRFVLGEPQCSCVYYYMRSVIKYYYLLIRYLSTILNTLVKQLFYRAGAWSLSRTTTGTRGQ